MTIKATSEDTRLDDEPVGLPSPGVHVLACTVRRTPMNTDAIFAAFKKTMGFPPEATAGYIQSGQRFPDKVLAELEANGHKQEYSRSAWVEMYVINPGGRALGQQVHESGWACDAFPVSSEFDLQPTHWTELSDEQATIEL